MPEDRRKKQVVKIDLKPLKILATDSVMLKFSRFIGRELFQSRHCRGVLCRY